MKPTFSFRMAVLTMAFVANTTQGAPLRSDKRPTSSGFEENKGQLRTMDGRPASFVRYRLTQGGTSVFLLGNGIAYQFTRVHAIEDAEAKDRSTDPDPLNAVDIEASQKKRRIETYRMDVLLDGADPHAPITTEHPTDERLHYYTHDALDVRAYHRVIYHDVYSGIDWVVRTTEHGVKYDFVVHPGADPGQIRLRFVHQEELHVDARGDLIHGNRLGRFTEKAPMSFQDGTEIPTRFVLDGNSLGFAVGAYDPSRTLVIDPDRIWATYYGDVEEEYLFSSCAVDTEGNVYLAGTSGSTAGIADGGYQNTYAGGIFDAFLAKFTSTGTRLWATYYGGIDYDDGRSCAVHGTDVYLTGQTQSTSGIASGGHQDTHGGFMDLYLAKFDGDGQLQWATYYGGPSTEQFGRCAVDNDGNICLAATTQSSTVPTAIASGGHQNTYGGGSYDAFLVKFNSDGTRLWGTYYGGWDNDTGVGCATDIDGNVFLSGQTFSDQGIASNGYDTVPGPACDAYLVKFDANGVRQWGTYYAGESAGGFGHTCTADVNGNVYLAGQTQSATGVGSAGHQNTFGGVSDAFLVKFDSDGQRLWSTYYGGTLNELAYACVADSFGHVYITGWVQSLEGIADGGHQNTYGGGTFDAFLAKFDATGARLWATYYGGDQDDQAWVCALDGMDAVYMTGRTASPSAIADGGHQNTYGGGDYDVFLVKFNADNGVGISAGQNAGCADMTARPNPTAGSLVISFDGADAAQRLMVLDATGRVVTSRSIEKAQGSITFDLADLTDGLYFLQAEFADGRRSIVRVVKE